MNFFELYKSILDAKQKRFLRREITIACGIEPTTFYTWFKRGIVPKASQKIISNLLKKTQTELFPEETFNLSEIV